MNNDAKIISYMLAEGIGTVFETHFYSFKAKFFQQMDKVPIGVKAVGAIASLVLLWWDDKFLQLVTTPGLVIYL